MGERILSENGGLPINDTEQLQKRIDELLREQKLQQRKYGRLEREYKQLGVLYENSERLRNFNAAEKELQYLYNRLLLAACPDIIFVLDCEMKHVIGTHVWKNLLGYEDAREMSGLSFQELCAGKIASGWVEAFLDRCVKALENLSSVNYSEKIVFVDGVQADMHVNISPAMDQSGGLRGVVVVLHNVTDLADALKRAENAGRAKTAFLAKMSHEIRTPMNAIKGMSDLLLLTQLSDVQRNYAANILGAAESLLTIIDEILDFSKIEAEKLEIIEAPYDFASMISDVAHIFDLKAFEKGLRFATEIDPTIPALLIGDQVRIKQVLINLLSNALKFTQEGFMKLSVKCLKRAGGDISLLFGVQDSGIGIREDEAGRLFLPFEQLDQKLNYGKAGSGLGLPISRSLAQLMNGRLDFKSVYGEGSTFFLEVVQKANTSQPLAAVENPDRKHVLLLGDDFQAATLGDMLRWLFVPFKHCRSEEEFAEALAQGDATHVIYGYEFGHRWVEKYVPWKNGARAVAVKTLKYASQQHTEAVIEVIFSPVLVMTLAHVLNHLPEQAEEARVSADVMGDFKVQGAKVLIVDDNAINLLVAEELLSHYGIEADTAEGGQSSLAMARRTDYDLIFMDHMMPEMDGVEVTQRLRAMGGVYADIPIVALTANAIAGMKEMFLENQMNDFVSKPIELQELARVLLQWLPADKIVGKSDVSPSPVSPDEIVFENEALHRLAFEINDVLDVVGALKAVGGAQSAYMNIIGVFSKGLPSRVALLEQYERQEDWNPFRIEVHALKSALANVGARSLSLEARSLEMAAHESRIEYIRGHLAAFLEELRELAARIQTVLSSSRPDAPEATQASDDDFRTLVSTLEQAEILMSNLDNDGVLELLNKAVRHTYGEDIDEYLRTARDDLDSFDYDSAENAVRKCLEILRSRISAE